MKELYTYALFFISVFLFSCQTGSQPRQEIHFEHVKDLAFPLPDSLNNVPSLHQLIQENGKSYLLIYFNKAKIVKYDVETREIVHTIPLSIYRALNFFYKSKDSIFVLYNMAYHPNYLHDNGLQRINEQGDTLNLYSMKGLPVLQKSNFEGKRTKEHAFFAGLFGEQLLMNQERIFFQLTFFGKSDYETVRFKKDTTIVGVGYSISNNMHQLHKGIEYPLMKKNTFYTERYTIKRMALSHNSNPIYLYGYTPTIFVFNQETQTFRQEQIASAFFDTIPPLTAENKTESMQDFPAYYYLRYIPEYNLYYRFLSLPETKYGNRYLAIAADTSFREVAEGLLPEGLSSKSFVYNNLMAFWNQAETFETEGKIIFSLYRVSFQGEAKTKLAARLKTLEKDFKEETCPAPQSGEKGSGDMLAYLNQTLPQADSSYAVIWLPHYRTCPACIDYTMQFFRANGDFLKGKPVYLLILNDNKPALKHYVAKYNLLVHPNVKRDTYKNYLPYHDGSEYLPRLIVVKNNQILSNKSYPASETEQLQIDLLTKFFDVEIKKQQEEGQE